MNKKYFLIFLIYSVCHAKDISLIDLEEKKQNLLLKKANILSEINSINYNIKIINEQIDQKKGVLNKRISSTLLLSRLKLNVFSYSNNFKQIERNLYLLRKINENDLTYIREQAYRVDDLKSEKNRLDLKAKDLDLVTREIETQEKLLQDQEEVESLQLQKKSQTSLLLLKGTLSKPIEADVSIPYGAEKANKNPYLLFRKGLFFNSTEGQIVQAIGPGKVIFSDVLNYWGESIILEHDGSYFSVYAGVKNCVVRLGQIVSKQQPLCEATNSDFYFELRHSKININPEKWIEGLK